MIYGIVVFPTEEVKKFANNYRKRYDSHYSRIGPHLTLKSAFSAEREDLPKIQQHLEQIAAKAKPFKVELHRFSTFYPTNNVIYMAVDNPYELEQLHHTINSGALAHIEPYSFIPHITIGQNLPDDELHDVYASLRMKRFKFIIPVDRFHLLRQNEESIWEEVQSFDLKG